MNRIKDRIRRLLSHYPKLYALIVGAGIVLFWRGVWHSVDQLHTVITNYQNFSSLDIGMSPWWDGPLSLIVGYLILATSGAFVSSFIGNEQILSGLRGEKRLNEKTEREVKSEIHAIADIRDQLTLLTANIEELEKRFKNHHS
jgi:hypothetical protein